MRAGTRSTILALALSMTAAAPAAAVIPCQDCEPDMPASTRCLGSCGGQIVRYCSDWFLFGCDSLVILPAQSRTGEEAGGISEEAFLRSLREEAAESARCE